ncbi:MAG: hypothetical protein ACTHLO_14550 [Pseudolabrys sp.]
MHMSNEAQALAGESLGESPDDSDYKAFLAVLAASARGRAFLAEHARRSRQADTEMLLAAIARIEDTLAEQRAKVATPTAPPPPPLPPGATALAAVAAHAGAAAQTDMPDVSGITAGSRPPPPHFEGEDFAGETIVTVDAAVVVEPAPAAEKDPATESNVIADTVPQEHAAPPGTPVADALGHILALSEEERLALFS